MLFAITFTCEIRHESKPGDNELNQPVTETRIFERLNFYFIVSLTCNLYNHDSTDLARSASEPLLPTQSQYQHSGKRHNLHLNPTCLRLSITPRVDFDEGGNQSTRNKKKQPSSPVEIDSHSSKKRKVELRCVMITILIPGSTARAFFPRLLTPFKRTSCR